MGRFTFAASLLMVAALAFAGCPRHPSTETLSSNGCDPTRRRGYFESAGFLYFSNVTIFPSRSLMLHPPPSWVIGALTV
jgi:hypothetical protein